MIATELTPNCRPPESYSPFPPRRDSLDGVTAKDVGPEIAAELDLRDGWPEPEPLVDILPDVMQFDPGLIPESFRPLVEDVADRMQVPLDFPAVTAAATLAGVTNRRATIQPKRNDSSWVVVPNLWGGIVGRPGLFKSPVISDITKPAREIEREWREAFAAEEKSYNVAQIEHEIEEKVWRTSLEKAIRSGKPKPSKPVSALVMPTVRRLITTDATFESLH